MGPFARPSPTYSLWRRSSGAVRNSLPIPWPREEVRERLQAAQTTEREVLNALIGNPALSDWYWRNERLEIGDRSALQFALSRVMDRIYAKTPIIWNELINRDRLSSQAAAARNKLFQHMLAHPGQARPRHSEVPAKSARSIGQYLKQGTFTSRRLPVGPSLTLARKTRSGFGPVGRVLNELVAASESGPVTLERLMDALATPPFGVKRGVFPILFLHYYLLHRFEIALFDEGDVRAGADV